MQSIQPLLKHIEGFNVKGVSTRTQNSDEFDEKKAKVPKLWQQFYAADLAANENIFGVYSDYESDANGLYTVTVGIASDEASGFIKVPTGNYLVFQAKGPMPATVIKIWQDIWSYFLQENKYQRTFISDFEAYNGSDEVAIYIGVK